MRHKNRRWLFVWAAMFAIVDILECECVKESPTKLARQSTENSTKLHEARSAFSPRMDYEQWTPIGRGDPLKNDPTYDYVPPILEHVHYWVDPASRKPDPQLALDTSKGTSSNDQNQKTEILVLGVSSKKPSIQPPPVASSADSRRDLYDPYLKYVENSPTKFQANHYQRERIYYPYSHYFPPSPSHQVYYKSKHDRYKPSSTQHQHQHEHQQSLSALGSSNHHQIPYTILMPPPLPKTEGPIKGTTESGVTIQPGNLIYYSSTLSEQNLQSIREDQENYHTADSTSVTWKTPLLAPHHIKSPQDYKEYKATTARPVIVNDQLYKMGKVENAHMDAMNTYVNIGKPEAHIQSESIPIPSPIAINNMPLLTNSIPNTNPYMHLQSQSPVQNNLLALLKKESKHDKQDQNQKETKQISNIQIQEPLLNPNVPSTMTSFLTNIPKATTKVYTTTTTPPSTPTTTTHTLTTDPLFKHYKQPAEPLRGPMYLIIQGHSKVKTYGPAKQLFGINVQEINEIPNYDNYKDFPVKHLHTYRKKEEYHPGERNGRGRSLDLRSLAEIAQTGYGAMEIEDIGQGHEEDDEDFGLGARQTKMEERIDEEEDGMIEEEGMDTDMDIKETELGAKFEVAETGTGDVYHKGIVEEVVKGIGEESPTMKAD